MTPDLSLHHRADAEADARLRMGRLCRRARGDSRWPRRMEITDGDERPLEHGDPLPLLMMALTDHLAAEL